MELREDDIVKHLPGSNRACWKGLITRPASARPAPTTLEKSSGVGTRRRFRTTTPGLVTRSTARSEGVQLLARIEAADGGDALTSPLQATVMNAAASRNVNRFGGGRELCRADWAG